MLIDERKQKVKPTGGISTAKEDSIVVLHTLTCEDHANTCLSQPRSLFLATANRSGKTSDLGS